LNAVRQAAQGLDPADDAHRTKDGTPACPVLAEACAFTVSRVMAAAAGLTDRPAPPAAAVEPELQATLAECNAMMRKTEQALKDQAKKETAEKAAAFLKEHG